MKKTLLICLLIISSLSAFAQVDLNKGLVLYLPFKGNTLDASPKGNHATNYGATLTADQWGNPNSAYRFDGTSSYMRIANTASLQCDTQITLCARVNVRGFYDGLCKANSIISKEDLDQTPGYYSLRFIASNNTAGSCTFQDTNHQNFYGSYYGHIPSTVKLDNPPYIKKDQWYCLVYVFDGVTTKMFVDGILRHQITTTSTIGKNLVDMYLGKTANPTYPYWFNGIMDEVRIYNRALNTLEIDSVCSKSNPQSNSIYEVQRAEVLPILSNPVNNALVLGLDNSNMGGTLRIIDMSGRKIMQVENLRTNTIAVERLAAGIYLVTYQFENTLMRVKMLKE